MIRTLFFYYSDHPETYRAVTRYIPDAEHIDTSASSYAYWDELARRWDGSSDLLTIESHIVIHDQVLPQLEACGNDWCVFPFGLREASGNFGSLQRHGLGCTRFSAALQQKVPAAEIRARARRKCPHCGAPHFAFIDGPVLDALRDVAGYVTLEPCLHDPPVEHLAE